MGPKIYSACSSVLQPCIGYKFISYFGKQPVLFDKQDISAWRKFLNTIDLLVGKSYESFRNGGVKLYQRHLDYTEFVSLMNTSAGYRKNNELLSRIDYIIFDLFGGSINGDNGSGIASRDNSAVDLSEFSEINPATGEPWIYNWDEYKPPLKWSDSRVKCFTSPVGYRNLFGKNFHTGLDISADGSGVEIFPIAPGKVVFASNDLIKHLQQWIWKLCSSAHQ